MKGCELFFVRSSGLPRRGASSVTATRWVCEFEDTGDGGPDNNASSEGKAVVTSNELQPV